MCALLFITTHVLAPQENELKKIFQDKLEGSMKHYDWTNEKSYRRLYVYSMTVEQRATKLWDTVQSEGKCCGVSRPDDWLKLDNPTNKYLPKSCCDNATMTESGTFVCTKNIYDKPCIKTVFEPLQSLKEAVRSLQTVSAIFVLTVSLRRYCQGIVYLIECSIQVLCDVDDFCYGLFYRSVRRILF